MLGRKSKNLYHGDDPRASAGRKVPTLYPSAEDTLLSEFQLAEAGCKVDSKPTTHTYPNGMMSPNILAWP